ncbi:MAG: NYN domain-containing protein [Ilumatobacteraceae bacterium]
MPEIPDDAPPDPGLSATGPSDTSIPDEALRSALEFAVSVAAAGARQRPSLDVPVALRRFTRVRSLTAASLAEIRRILGSEPEFRAEVSARATRDLVDPIGLLWLTRPDGWYDDIAMFLDDSGTVEMSGRREERRRRGAEDALARVRRELIDAQALHDRALVEAAAREAALSAELVKVRGQLDEVRQRLRAAQRASRTAPANAVADAQPIEIDTRETGLADLTRRLREAEAARDHALASLVDLRGRDGSAVDLERARRLLAEVTAALGGQPTGRARRPATRRPLPVPGGLLADSAAAAEHVIRHRGVTVVVDGYNVAKLGWPERTLADQREACLAAAERIAVRWGTAIHVVFDGADVVGAHTRGRRLVRVTFSPPGVIADDVIRAEVGVIPVDRPVVVVTDDQAVVADVRAAGANVVASATFLGLAAP